MAQLYTKDGHIRNEKYVRAWINKADLPDPFVPADVAPYGWVEYVEPPKTLAELQEIARVRINEWRFAEENTGFTALGHTWDSTPASREKLTTAALRGRNPVGFWTSSDDVDVPVTVPQLLTILDAMIDKGAAIHARQRELKLAIPTMTYEQLQSFVPGW